MLPEGCTIFSNDWGTAPGCAFQAEGVHVIMLPGPPSECGPMFQYRAAPYLRQLSEGVILSHTIKLFGIGEATVEARLREQMNAMTNPTLAPYAKEGECELRVTAKAAAPEEAQALLRPTVDQIKALFGSKVYGVDVPSIEAVVEDLLRQRGMTLGTAESCTGGLIAQRLTSVSGSSEVFGYGFVTYWEQAKAKLVGVDPAVIEKYNVVSAPVAAQMALGAAKASGADIAVSVTGVAGPTGGDEVRPVGTVYLGAARDGVACVKKLFVSRPDRALVRARAAQAALELALRLAQGKVPAGTQALTAAQQSDDEALAALDEVFVR